MNYTIVSSSSQIQHSGAAGLEFREFDQCYRVPASGAELSMCRQPNTSSAKCNSYLGKQGLEDFAHTSLPDKHLHLHNRLSRKRIRSFIGIYGDVTDPVLKPGISISFFCLYPYLSKCSMVLKSVLVTLSALIRNCLMTRRCNRSN